MYRCQLTPSRTHLDLPWVVEGHARRNIPRNQRHRANHHVIANVDAISNDATVGPHAHVVANAQCVLLQPQGLDADRAVLPDEEVAPDAYMPGNHHPRQVRDAQAGGDLGADVDVHPILEVEPLLHAPGVAPGQAAAGVEVLGQAIGEKETQFVVLACAAQHVEQQADRASGSFLVGDFQSPAFEQVVEVHAEISVGLALHHAELVPKTQPSDMHGPSHPKCQADAVNGDRLHLALP